ncbi:hypothetical protein EAE96_008284 [Botrytis aclada]|nr:hypothetical protein EAE96_008284 [Botrytis aclada]
MDIIEDVNQAASAFITNIPPSLQNIPTEIRRNIFEYLLVNTELGEASSIDQDEIYGGRVKYGLSPQVLLVCRLFHVEGKEILYGLNHFIVESLPNIHVTTSEIDQPATLCSPLTRWDNELRLGIQSNSVQKALLHENTGIRLVKKWRMILSAKFHEPRSRDGLVELCRLLCELQTISGGTLLKELEVCIIPKGVEFEYGYLDPADMRENLAPLELLRNIPRVSIRTANISEIPDYVCRDEWFDTPIVTKSMLPTVAYRRFLIDLIQGSSEVEMRTKMFDSLMEYTQAFERDPDFKKAMSLSFEEVATLMTGDLSTLTDNPYLNKDFHPRGLVHTIEASLQKARYMTETDSGDITQTTKFKEERSVVLKYLERQFLRISYASQELVELVRLQKRKWGIFDPACTKQNNGFDMVIYTEAMVLLEDYVASFSRELDPSTKRAVRAQFGLFGHRYEFMPRETNLKKFRIAYNRRDPITFRKYFQELVNDMDLQYWMILTARSKLYYWDAGSNVPDIEITPLASLEDWKIEWDKEEPTMTAITEYEAEKIENDDEHQIAKQILLTQQMVEPDIGYFATESYQGLDIVDGVGIYGHNAITENNTEDSDSTEAKLHEIANWESLPYHDDDDFYVLTYQLDDNQPGPSSTGNAPKFSDSASENDFYEELFRDHPDDESFDLESEDENNYVEDNDDSGGAAFYVLPWLADSRSSLSHVFPWMTRSQQ